MSEDDACRFPSRGFPTTHWSAIAEAVSEDPAGTRPALSGLLSRYRPPILRHLRRSGLALQDSEDVLHDFVSRKVLQNGLLATADRRRGRFRTLLLTALDRYVIDRHRFRDARTRHPPRAMRPFDEHCDTPASPGVSVDPFDLEWAHSVISQALTRMREDSRVAGRDRLWSVFEARFLRPILEQEPPEPYSDLVQRLGIESYSQATKIATESKHIMQRYLYEVVAEYEPDQTGVAAELHDLFRILGEAGGAGCGLRIE